MYKVGAKIKKKSTCNQANFLLREIISRLYLLNGFRFYSIPFDELQNNPNLFLSIVTSFNVDLI